MSPTHVDDSSMDFVYNQNQILSHPFEYNRIDMYNLQYFRLYSKSLLESLIVSSIIESMKVRC